MINFLEDRKATYEGIINRNEKPPTVDRASEAVTRYKDYIMDLKSALNLRLSEVYNIQL